MLLGGLLSATDPVAVVALLKELGASKKLNTIVEGESLMNDGFVIFFPFGRQKQTHLSTFVSFFEIVSMFWD